MAIIPPNLTDLIRSIFYRVGEDYEFIHHYQGEMGTILSHIDKYLYGHPDILEKRLIFLFATSRVYIGMDSVL